MIHHPLIIASVYGTDIEQIERFNAAYAKMMKLAREFKSKRQFASYLLLIKRPYRLDVFVDELIPLLKDQQYWKLLSNIWTDAENPHVNHSTWVHLFASKRKFRPLLMNKAERAALAAMPEVLTVYRGGRTKRGLSWTLSEEKARWFADRHKDKGVNKVFKGTVPKHKVYAYLNGRKEEEIVVDPKFVTLK